FISHFTTADQTPPVLISFTPSDGAVQVDPRSVIRLTFNKPIRNTNFTLTVAGPSGAVAGTTTVALNAQAIIFTPAATLNVNATYTVSVDGITDLAGNLAANLPFVVRFATLDTIGPDIAQLRIADGVAPIAGSTVAIEALLVVNEPGASVRFTQDFVPVAVATQGPSYRASLTLPASGTTIIRAIATDRYGNDGNVKQLTLSVTPPEAPTVSLVELNPTNGWVNSGQTFSVAVNASGDLLITNLTVIGVGALTISTNFFGGGSNVMTFLLPAATIPNTPFELRAQAVDALGLKSSIAVLDLNVADTTAPTVAVLSPAVGTVLDPTRPLNVTVVSSDNAGNHTLQVELAGSVATTQTVSVAAMPNTPITNSLLFSLTTAQPDGSQLQITVRGTDASNNTTSVTQTYFLLDTIGPKLLSLSPGNGMSNVSIWLDAVAFQFSEPIAAASANSTNVVSTNNAGLVQPYELAQSSPSTILLTPTTLPLVPGVTYTNRLLPGITDAHTNALTQSDGSALAAPGLPTTFTTARILSVAPTNNSQVLSGQTLNVAVAFESGLGADRFRFVLDGGVPFDAPVIPGAASALTSVPVPAYASPTNVLLAITAMKAGSPPYNLPPVPLSIITSLPDTNTVNISGINHVTVVAGQTTNILLVMTAPGSALSLADYAPTNPAPAFVSLSSLQITNGPLGGTGSVQVNFNPLHDAVGDRIITIRAASRKGKVATFDIALTILSDGGLQVTHWTAPLSGNWSDPSKWSAGVPGPNTIAVIDAEGSYTVTVDVQPAMRGLVLNQTNAVLYLAGSYDFAAPVELRAGQLTLGYDRSIAMNNAWVNEGVMQFYSGDVNTYVNGGGWIENRGLIESSLVGSQHGQTQIRVASSITSSGRMLVDSNSAVGMYGGGSLVTAGTVEAQGGASLYFFNDGPPHDLTVLTGGQLAGTGLIQFSGSNRLILQQDVATGLQLALNENCSVTGPGTLTFLTSQALRGLYETPLVVPSGITLEADAATLTNWVSIQRNALFYINNNQTLTLNGALTNFGTFEMFSRDVSTYLGGSGTVENRGAAVVYPVGNGGGVGQIRLRFENAADGTLRVATNASMGFYGNSA
ncbi:MAG TPA: Ig-like domain-containing protein, partial [Verrucomicrobiae bacterium]|nr:Ig-like domain-containing protein [Verrucomicrobiae bacterium]